MSVEDQLAYWKRRARDAERRVECEGRHNKHTTYWAHQAFAEQRRLSERLMYFYGLAVHLGATAEQMHQPNPQPLLDPQTMKENTP